MTHDLTILAISLAMSLVTGYGLGLWGRALGMKSERKHWVEMVDLLALNIATAQMISHTQMVNGDSILEALNAMVGNEIVSSGPDSKER